MNVSMIAVEDSRGFVMGRGHVSAQSKIPAVFMDVEANNVVRDV
jgi:hypothetical protein